MLRLMEVEKMKSLLISLISLFVVCVYAGDNSVEVRTKGSSSLIHIDQIGTGNTARVWCGLSEGTYNTHNCSNAEIDIDQEGTGNTARAYSQVANHTGNEYKIDQDGNDNFGYIDADDDSNDMDVIQNGNDNDATIYMQGDDNIYKITQTGDDKEGIIRAFGDDSEFTITQSGSGEHYAKIYASGSADNNDADIAQTGSGNHSMTLNFYTDDYNVDATQSGSTPKSITATYNCSINCTKTITINQSD
jgi:hypothetical protein